MSTGELGSITYITPEISPSVINFKLTLIFKENIIFSCLGLSNTHTVIFLEFFLASAKERYFFQHYCLNQPDFSVNLILSQFSPYKCLDKNNLFLLCRQYRRVRQIFCNKICSLQWIHCYVYFLTFFSQLFHQ